MQTDSYSREDRRLLHNCILCPWECHIDRYQGGTGVCTMDAGLNIASICIHRGEEPVLGGEKGICNVFFSGCNLNCIYCQNHEISQPKGKGKISGGTDDINNALDQIEAILSAGINTVGFVSPSHNVPQMKSIIKGLHSRGYRPVTIYNTNGYDKAETLKEISDLIDIYLPDYKYVTPAIAASFSGAFDYPLVALKALKEMYYQKGSSLRLDEKGHAEYGLIIRHLVLPGYAEESIKVLNSVAGELSAGVHISMMSQYYPANRVANHPSLNRPLYKAEYDLVVEEMKRLGFRNGWSQDMESSENYRPDFSRENPFS
jgi:putative pyruvate formate lyase activating enzyme